MFERMSDQRVEWLHESWYWVMLRNQLPENIVPCMIEDALMDAISDQCDGFIDLTPFPGLCESDDEFTIQCRIARRCKHDRQGRETEEIPAH